MDLRLGRVPLYTASRWLGRRPPLPMNLTFSVTYRCNARCHTCNVWQKRDRDLALEEYGRVFRALGRSPYWLTFSGGEPFLRPDLVDIVLAAIRACRPAIVNIPTNGLLEDRVVDGVARLAREGGRTAIVVNLSLDGIREEHDRLRGVPGNYARLRETYRRLRALGAPNVTLGIHTVISRQNVERVPALLHHVRETFAPDSLITEVAEERVELDTIGLDITPDADSYESLAAELRADLDRHPATGPAGIAQALRRRYYRIVGRTLRERRQVLPCYAGVASAHVAPGGDVWTCCTRAEPLGNLREAGYDLGRIWAGARAAELRASIRRRECHCPLANAAYTSMLCDPRSLVALGWAWLGARLRRPPPRPPAATAA